MKHEEIAKTIIGCAFEVINELGTGFLESDGQDEEKTDSEPT